MINVSDVNPDWQTTWTADEAEKELIGFKFNGPGFYISEGDTILVFPVGEVADPWIQVWPKDQRFRFMVYDQRNPADSFNAIIHAPVREDDRGE